MFNLQELNAAKIIKYLEQSAKKIIKYRNNLYMTENQQEKILQMLINSSLTSYFIAKRTEISAQSIINYRNKSTKPTKANLKLLEYFFKEQYNIENVINHGNCNQIINANGAVTADNRQYHSDSPDILKAQIDILEDRIKEKDAQIKEKDAQIKEKDAQIKEKDAQINKLLEIMGK